MTPPAWHADLVLTFGLAAVAWFAGRLLVSRSGWLRRSNVPVPAVGGLLFAFLVLALSSRVTISIDTTLRAPLQIAFFTTIGFKATTSLLRAGGRRMVVFWLIASGTAIVQTVVGVGVARLTGAPPLLGLICGAVTLTGGPATGLAFTDTFERLGIEAAGELIMASATFGIFVASLVGNPVATWLIRRFDLAPASPAGQTAADRTRPATHAALDTPALTTPALLLNLFLLLVVMGVGVLGGKALERGGVTLPAFIVPMILAALVRSLEDHQPRLGFHEPAMDAIGVVALALFLLIALMDLKLWQVAALAVPMVAILLAQTVITVIYCVLTTFLLMGRDYEAAVMTSGHIGFGLGITPNAVANMDTLVVRYGPAPVSFLIVPVIGAFFIDFSNPLIITAAIWILR